MGADVSQRKATVITVSNRASQGIYEDSSGQILAEGLRAMDYDVARTIIVADDRALIAEQIVNALQSKIDLIVTTGGTGVSPSDVTPEATAPLIEKLLPGFSEALREYSRTKVATTDLTRGLADAGGSFIINLPGSPGAVRDGLVIIARLASHVLDQLAGEDHPQSL